MGVQHNETRLKQSQAITRIGCFGAALVIVLLVIIGLMAVRMSVTSKKNAALASLARVREQVEKTPGILDRMTALGCASSASTDAAEIRSMLDKTAPDDIDGLDRIWNRVEEDWTGINQLCSGESGNFTFIGLSTEMEGVRNRRSVERAKYAQSAEEYNTSLNQSFVKLVAPDLKPLSLGRDPSGRPRIEE